jgi:hypothetical protein
MTRRYTFPDTPQGALRCTLAWTAMANRGNPADGQRKSTSEQRSEGRIVRALKAITIPAPSQPEPERGQPDLRARQLKEGGGAIELDQPDFKRLVEYIESMQWAGAVTDEVSDFLDSLEVDSAKVDDSKKAETDA